MNTIWNLPLTTVMPFEAVTEDRPVALLTSGPAWSAVRDRLPGLRRVWQAEVTQATLAHWDSLAAELRGAPEAEGCVLYAVGGGLVADAAKYVAVQLDLPLVCLPTALSVDAYLTWASGYRRDGCVAYLATRPPDRLVIDFDVLAAAPPNIRAAGLCDVLSIATGCWDWLYAEERGYNPPEMAYIPYVYDAAQAILRGGLECAEAAGSGDRDGLKQLFDCLALEVQLCNQVGHSRPEEGSEHYFAYAVENTMGHGLPHGDLVGPGIVIMAEAQGQDSGPLRRALAAAHVPLDTIPPDVVEATLRDLPAYVRRHTLPYGRAHTL
jgi:glycerol-1-phosphate dehydrogenase [NAD(P)+]